MAEAPAETPAPPTGPNGYVFLCRNVTQVECLNKSIFALKDRAIDGMKTAITAETSLFLLNINSGALVGVFAPVGSPELNIDAEAFGGEFSAQVKVTPVDNIKAVKIDSRIGAGVKTGEEVAKIKEMLTTGESIDPYAIDEDDKGYGSKFPSGKGKGKGFKGKGKWFPPWFGKGMFGGKGKGMEGLWMLAYGNKGFGKGRKAEDGTVRGDPETKVKVRGLPEATKWQDLKEHMAKGGTVEFVQVAGEVGEVRYASAEVATAAIQSLNGSQFQEKTITVEPFA